MPDRKRAVFYGTNHGAPCRTNDVWEYDLPSNTWVCLFAPEELKTQEQIEKNIDRRTLESGVPMTKGGGPAVPPHTWWQMTYDPERKAMLILSCWSIINHTEVKKAYYKGRSTVHRMPLWAFYPESRKWKPVTNSKHKGRRPTATAATVLEYIPELQKPVYFANTWKARGMWSYDAKSNTWEDLKPNGGNPKSFERNSPGYEQVMVYVPDRKMLVGHKALGPNRKKRREFSGVTCHYSFKSNEWKRVMTRKGDRCWGRDEKDKKTPMPIGTDYGTPFVYDQVGKVCLLVQGSTLWAYDPGKIEWTRITPKGPAPTGGLLHYYDAARNVFVITEPARKKKDGRLWVYRHKRRGKSPEKE
jgi:hypothetical protein